MFDLTPILKVMATGLMLAGVPLLWWWLSHRQATVSQRLAKLCLLTLFFTFDLILFGAFTRLTDSGLGCPDWPGCYGYLSPWGAQAHIADAQALLPTGPVTHVKAWIEMLHRYLATGVGVLILALTIASWYFWRKKNTQSRSDELLDTNLDQNILNPWWSTITLIWVCAQGMFGALTVTMKLFPAIVSLHLLGAIGLLVLLVIQTHAYTGSKPVYIGANKRYLLWLVTILLGLQIALGAWVSTNYAVLACNTFPMCQGSWWPDMNFIDGFSLWRELGHTTQGSLLSFSALVAIHYVHRLIAYLVIAAVLILYLNFRLINGLVWQRRYLLGLIFIQFISGLSNVVLDWPLLAALVHTGGAAALMAVLTWSLCASRSNLLG